MKSILASFKGFILLFVVIIAVGLIQISENSMARSSIPKTHPTLRFVPENSENGSSRVELIGLDEKILSKLEAIDLDFETFASLFAIFTVTDESIQTTESRPVIGEYSFGFESLQFMPRYPFEPSVSYQARADLVEINTLLGKQSGFGNSEVLKLTFSLPTTISQTNTVISSIYPTSDVLPENLLRFYVYFSEPMRRGEAYDHMYILDPNGDIVERPFLLIGRELWNPSMTRLTVMLDPGRIKRDMSPNLQAGLPLQSGINYQFVIDENWQDANGNPLVASYKKDFQVVAADFDSPHIESWEVLEPSGNTKEPLVVRFPESMDFALLNRFLSVHYVDDSQDVSNVEIKGVIEIAAGEKEWRFSPVTPWLTGHYQLIVDTRLEDVAGNSLKRAFDTDLQDHKNSTIMGDSVKHIFSTQ